MKSKNNENGLRYEGQKITFTKEMLEEVFKCSEDICYFAENYYYIVSLDKGKIKIPLWDFQKKFLKACVKTPNDKRHIIALASRQISKTTMASIYLLHSILFKKDFKIAILANKERTATDILDKVKLAYRLLPLFLQKGVKEWNKQSITFEDDSKIYSSSTASNAIRGMSFNVIMLDEFAFVSPNIQREFMSSVLPTISSGKTAKIIMLSTPNKMEMFYSIWSEAIRDLNNYYPIKIMWHEVPGRDEEWKKNMIKDLPDHELQFNVEFGCKFLGSSNTLIDVDVLEKIKTKPYEELKWNGLMKVYESPKKGCKYCIGVDVGGGRRFNYSVVQVLKINAVYDIEQVAMYRCNTISPYELCHVVIAISDYYNKCYCMIENNADVGGILVSQLWTTHEFDRIINNNNKDLGIRATTKTKTESNILLKRYIEKGWLKINDRDTVHELSLYEEKTLGRYAAGDSDNDDCVTSLSWALYFILTPEFGQDVIPDDNPSEIEDKYRLGDNDVKEEEFEPTYFIDI